MIRLRQKPEFFTLKGMRYRSLGKTGLTVSEIGFGGWAIGGNAHGHSYGSTDDTVSLKALNQAYELGCTLFDTADTYGHGHSETLLGQALKGWKREEVVIASKGGYDFQADPGLNKQNFSETALRAAIEASLTRLQTDTIDVYQLHNPPLELILHGQVFEVLKTLQQEGKLRFYGVSIHDPMEGVRALEIGTVDAVQAIWNLFDRRIEKALIPACTETKTGLIVREPLARGFLAGKFQTNTTFEAGDVRSAWPKPLIQKRLQAAEQFKPLVPAEYQSLAQLAIAYPLHEPSVSVVIAGCKTPEQVRENMTVSDLARLSAEQVQQLQALNTQIFGSL